MVMVIGLTAPHIGACALTLAAGGYNVPKLQNFLKAKAVEKDMQAACATGDIAKLKTAITAAKAAGANPTAIGDAERDLKEMEDEVKRQALVAEMDSALQSKDVDQVKIAIINALYGNVDILDFSRGEAGLLTLEKDLEKKKLEEELLSKVKKLEEKLEEASEGRHKASRSRSDSRKKDGRRKNRGRAGRSRDRQRGSSSSSQVFELKLGTFGSDEADAPGDGAPDRYVAPARDGRDAPCGVCDAGGRDARDGRRDDRGGGQRGNYARQGRVDDRSRSPRPVRNAGGRDARPAAARPERVAAAPRTAAEPAKSRGPVLSSPGVRSSGPKAAPPTEEPGGGSSQIQQLMEMGFSEAICRRVFRECAWDFNKAHDRLLYSSTIRVEEPEEPADAGPSAPDEIALVARDVALVARDDADRSARKKRHAEVVGPARKAKRLRINAARAAAIAEEPGGSAQTSQIQSLMEMGGFSEALCRRVFRECAWDFDKAVDRLLSTMGTEEAEEPAEAAPARLPKLGSAKKRKVAAATASSSMPVARHGGFSKDRL